MRLIPKRERERERKKRETKEKRDCEEERERRISLTGGEPEPSLVIEDHIPEQFLILFFV